MFGRKKQPVDFCRAQRLVIAYQYIHTLDRGGEESFINWFSAEFDGLRIDAHFLNECLEEYGEYAKEFPFGEDIVEMRKKIPSKLGDEWFKSRLKIKEIVERIKSKRDEYRWKKEAEEQLKKEAEDRLSGKDKYKLKKWPEDRQSSKDIGRDFRVDF